MARVILIVDDSPAELANLRAILDQHGWHSVCASSGSEAVAKASSERPSLILMDIVMPEVDGYEACRRLQADASTKNIPVVFVSSKCQKADQMWARMQGGKTLISKPYAPQQIVDAVKAYA